MQTAVISYHFNHIDACNMCGSSTFKILGKRLNQSQGRSPYKKLGITTTICKCSTCDLIYANPQPIPLDIQDHYGVSPENYWNEDYFTVTEDYFQDGIHQLKRLMDVKPGMKSLDIGAGLGKQMISLRQIGFDTYGFEPSKTFYDCAISRMGIDSGRLKLGTIEEMEYPADHFHFVSFGAVLEHLYDPSSAIKKTLGWLKPGGLIHIEVPSSSWLIGKLINLAYKIRMMDYVGNLSPMHQPYHLFEFSLNSFRENALRLGYEIAYHEYYVCQTYLPAFFNYFLKPLMKKNNTGMQLCVWLRKPEI